MLQVGDAVRVVPGTGSAEMLDEWSDLTGKVTALSPEGGKPKRSGKADAPPVKREPDAEALEAPVAPELPHLKPEPKPRGCKKPLR